MNKNFINDVNLEKVICRELGYPNGTVTIIKAGFRYSKNEPCLQLVLFDIDKFEHTYGHQAVYDHCQKSKYISFEDYVDLCYREKNTKNIRIPSYVIKIKNPLLRDDRTKDFEVVYGNKNNCTFKYSLHDESFANKVANTTNFKELPFPTIIKSLRNCLLDSFDEKTKLYYRLQYNEYCEKLIETANKLVNDNKKQDQ